MGFPIGEAAGELELRELALPPLAFSKLGLMKALPQSFDLGETSQTNWVRDLQFCDGCEGERTALPRLRLDMH